MICHKLFKIITIKLLNYDTYKFVTTHKEGNSVNTTKGFIAAFFSKNINDYKQRHFS